ncbi:MAG: TRAP transporter substrate-binding protein [Albidovulum sp.]|nr:TRAP transporter substrate-binding protein [Albidovulum sp.]MDE0532985.1 TRAP transporter substrate-binding protein [Albidovulum sp.]
MNRVFKIVAAVAASVVVAIPASAQNYRWDMPNEYAKASGHYYDEIFAQKLRDATGGAIDITNHYGGALGYKSKDHWKVVEDGAAQIASTYTGVFSGIDPVFLLVSMPFLARNIDESRALYEAARPWYEAAFEKGNQMLVLAVPFPPVGIWAKQPVTNLEELGQIKIRTYDKTSTVSLNEAGANAVQLSWADIIPALTTGTIDAVLTAGEGGVLSSFYEHMDHFNAINYVAGTQMFHINKDSFDSLSPELQETLLRIADEIEDEAWEAIKERVDNSYVKMGEQGVTVVTEDDLAEGFLDALREASSVVFNEWRDKMPNGAADEIMDSFGAKLAAMN